VSGIEIATLPGMPGHLMSPEQEAADFLGFTPEMVETNWLNIYPNWKLLDFAHAEDCVKYRQHIPSPNTVAAHADGLAGTYRRCIRCGAYTTEIVELLPERERN